MNLNHYEEIYSTLKMCHPELEKEVIDYRPLSNIGIRVTTKNGTKYDFDMITKGLRRVPDEYRLKKDEITDDMCRQSFSVHLCDFMTKNGYTQQSLSEYTGISKGSINAYVNGSKTPSLTNVRKSAHALNCSIAELID